MNNKQVKFKLTKNQLETFNDILDVLLINSTFGINKDKDENYYEFQIIKQLNENSKGTIKMSFKQLELFTDEKYYNDTDEYYLGWITMNLIQEYHNPTDKQYSSICKPHEKLIDKLLKIKYKYIINS